MTDTSLIWDEGSGPWTLILAHGAGAPMDSPFMNSMAAKIAAHDITCVRFEFDYMAARREDGRKRPPNPQTKLLEQWRARVEAIRSRRTGPLAIGGKSMGGRMASMIADEVGADALVCLGYPFHAPGKQDKPRVAHLAELKTPTLIMQGDRDAMGAQETVQGYTLAPAIRIHWLPSGNHDLEPLKRSGHTHDGHLQEAATRIQGFLAGLA